MGISSRPSKNQSLASSSAPLSISVCVVLQSTTNVGGLVFGIVVTVGRVTAQDGNITRSSFPVHPRVDTLATQSTKTALDTFVCFIYPDGRKRRQQLTWDSMSTSLPLLNRQSLPMVQRLHGRAASISPQTLYYTRDVGTRLPTTSDSLKSP